MRTEVEALKALVYQTTEDYLSGKHAPEHIAMLASMCKLKVGRVSREVTDACLQFWGGQGYMWDNLVTRAYRDTRLVSIGGGARSAEHTSALQSLMRISYAVFCFKKKMLTLATLPHKRC